MHAHPLQAHGRRAEVILQERIAGGGGLDIHGEPKLAEKGVSTGRHDRVGLAGGRAMEK